MHCFRSFLLTCCVPLLLAGCRVSLPAAVERGPVVLFENLGTEDRDFRIPAIVLRPDGALVAFADRRYSERGADIGAGRIDIQSRISRDGGRSWDGSPDAPRTVVYGSGGSGFDCAHGDAAVVCDKESGRILLMCASGSVGFGQGGCNIGRYYSEDGGLTFSGGEMTVDNGLPKELAGQGLFFSSGRICQSSLVKKGKYYRIYSGVVTASGSQIVYSDDFGQSWNVLGKPLKAGNESKVEELPDGSLLHSCRISNRNGRIFRVLKYKDQSFSEAEGSPGRVCPGMIAAGCNGEIMISPLGRDKWVLLQSVARSSKRENVSVYYKVFSSEDPFTDEAFYDSWDGFIPMSTTSSCYSTMAPDGRGGVVILFEENNKPRDWVETYDIVFNVVDYSAALQMR